MEKYLRQYVERGNPIPTAALAYLNNPEELETEDWEMPMQIQPPDTLADLLPLTFDPLNPTSMVKQIFGLRKEGNIVRVNTTDGRKSEAAKERAKNLKNLKTNVQSSQSQPQAQAIVPLQVQHHAPIPPGIFEGAAAGGGGGHAVAMVNNMGQQMNHHMGGQEANHLFGPRPEMNGDVRKRRNPLKQQT